MADTTIMSNSFEIRRVFAAPVRRVFQAWTEPRELAGWVWGPLTVDASAVLDLQVGGRYAVYIAAPEGSTDGRDRHGMVGWYADIAPNRRLAYTLHWDAPVVYNETGESIPDELIIVEFEEHKDGTEVLYRHLGIPSDETAVKMHAEGTAATFDSLDALLQAEP